MGKITGTSSYIYFETDIFPGLAITEENPGLYATAYGMLADFVRAQVRDDAWSTVLACEAPWKSGPSGPRYASIQNLPGL